MFVTDSRPRDPTLRPPKHYAFKRNRMPVLPACVSLKLSVLKKALSILPTKERGIELLHFNCRIDSRSSDTVIIRYSYRAFQEN